jgi:hypothetical protein
LLLLKKTSKGASRRLSVMSKFSTVKSVFSTPRLPL